MPLLRCDIRKQAMRIRECADAYSEKFTASSTVTVPDLVGLEVAAPIPSGCWPPTPTAGSAYRAVAERLDVNTAVSLDAEGRVHVATVKAIEEPASLVELRKRVEAMIPPVDVSEVILEVLGWCPAFLDSLTSISGGRAHLADLDISVAIDGMRFVVPVPSAHARPKQKTLDKKRCYVAEYDH